MVSRKAVAALVVGLLALVSGLFAVSSRFDLSLVGIPFFWGLSLLLGTLSLVDINRAKGTLSGRRFATWGMGIPTGGFVLGFLVLPHI